VSRFWAADNAKVPELMVAVLHWEPCAQVCRPQSRHEAVISQRDHLSPK
jgi:hypothetical protein